jgi:cytoplasmic iron level regulating protein YaaA (DUF328/UPF0246 family)
VEALGLTAGLAGEVDKDAVLTTSPTLPASKLYTGVLYEALGLTTLDAAALRRARRSLLISSALFGAVRLTDRLPTYRLSMTARLPRARSTLAAQWRTPLQQAMPAAAGRSVILDLRSGPYAAMWRPKAELASRTASVRVLHEAVPGDRSTRSIVSHFNKATKGRLVRSLLIDGRTPSTVDELVDLLSDLGWTVEPGPATAGVRAVDVVVPQV